MDNNLITVAEYARIRGCSTAAVYKRLDTTLKPYSKTVNNKTYLSRQVLVDEGLITVENQGEPEPEENKGVEITVDNDLKPPQQPESPALLETIKILEKQLEAKDREIDRLHQENEDIKNQLAEAARHNQEHTEKLTELLAQAQELNRNNQILLAQATQPALIEAPQPEAPPEQPPKKKGWFARWFLGEE